METFAVIILAVIAIFFSEKARQSKPPISGFIENSFTAKFYVWYWPFGNRWRSYLGSDLHPKFKIYRMYFVWAFYFVLLMLLADYYVK